MTNLDEDFTRPSMARVYNYWLGGRDNFAADREQAHRIEAAYPPLPAGQVSIPRRNVRCARRFLERAVDFAARQDVDQFAQLGAGLPAPAHYPALHDIARDFIPGARFAYTDSDAVTVSLTRALLDEQDVDVIKGHAAETGALLAALGQVIDLEKPACLILSMVLQLMDPQQAKAVAGAYISALAPESFVVIACPRCDPPADDPELWQRLRAARTARETWNHSQEEILSFFGGDMELVPPGLVPAAAWHPVRPAGMRPASASYVLAGVGRKA